MADGDVRSPEPWPPGRVLVVVATYKEEATIAALMAGVLGVAADLHLLVVDDESPDGTPQLALAEGLTLAKHRGFAVAVTMDADASHDPDDIPRLLAALGRMTNALGSLIGRIQAAGTRLAGVEADTAAALARQERAVRRFSGSAQDVSNAVTQISA
ncbi:MAG: glycosyltransferase, partial [Planctomycetia bacterium]|nr:glycosyltransferase [Planctomycetia bacterium]